MSKVRFLGNRSMICPEIIEIGKLSNTNIKRNTPEKVWFTISDKYSAIKGKNAIVIKFSKTTYQSHF